MIQALRIIKQTAATLCAATLAFTASAATTTFTLPFIGNWGTDYETADASLTFTGNGYIGLYDPPARYGYLFGLEPDYSRTHIQQNINALAGKTVTSATLSFVLKDGDSPVGSSDTFTVTAYPGTGILGHQWDPPAVNFGSLTFPLDSPTISADITSLVSTAVASGNFWLNLHLSSIGNGYWTYVMPDADPSEPLIPDNAELRLTVVYQDATVPAVAVPSLQLYGLVVLGLLLLTIAAARSRQR